MYFTKEAHDPMTDDRQAGKPDESLEVRDYDSPWFKCDEVPITPEMLEEGRSLVASWDYDSPSLEVSTHEGLARLIYVRMRLVALGKAPKKLV